MRQLCTMNLLLPFCTIDTLVLSQGQYRFLVQQCTIRATFHLLSYDLVWYRFLKKVALKICEKAPVIATII